MSSLHPTHCRNMLFDWILLKYSSMGCYDLKHAHLDLLLSAGFDLFIFFPLLKCGTVLVLLEWPPPDPIPSFKRPTS